METDDRNRDRGGIGRRVWRALASPRITVTLILWLGALTVWGTLYQTSNGLYAAQQRFFHSWIFWTAGGWLPLPGWYGSMAVLAVNLVPSMILRFPRRGSAAGLWVIHLGIFVFLLGGWVTRQFGRESDLKIIEGDQSSVAVAPMRWELAFWKDAGGTRQVVAFDSARLKAGQSLALPEWNLSVRINRIAPNGDAGVGADGVLRAIRPKPVGKPETARPVAELQAGAGGRPVMLAGTDFEEGAPIDAASGVFAALRRQRHALPFTVKLIDFKKEFHPNSGIAREYSSRVEILMDGVPREVLISMNKPFRHGNFTLFQSSFETAPDGREASVFSVAENKGRLLPYIASTLISLGMVMLYLPRLFARRAAAPRAAAVALLLLALPLTTAGAEPAADTAAEESARIPPDVATELGRLPVLENGRVMPLDTYARLAMTQLRGMANAPSNETATAWLLRLMTNPRSTIGDPVLLINHPEAAEAIGLEVKKPRDRYSYHAVSHGRDRLLQLAQSIYRKPASTRREAEAELLRLWQSVELFEMVVDGELPHLPAWTAGDARIGWVTPAKSPDGAGWAIFQLAVRSGDPELMRKVASKWTSQSLGAMAPRERQRLLAEVLQDRSRLKPATMTLYLLAFVLAIPALKGGRAAWRRAAMTCALLGVVGGTVLLGLRIFITAMPPVTNLYSSFLFVGWGAALLALIAARRMPDGYGEMLAGAAGFLSLWVSMAFAPSSDTMAPVVAVLNSKFWLLTHVLTIALGYSGCLIAGLAAHVYLVLVARGRTDEAVNRLRAFLYGTLRFGLLFTFIGTVTGGIWADQSWGRFWGWDPKENGALLIVLWCSALLHARPNRIIDDNGFAAGCIVGNAIVAVAWLGVNLLGVGLHSYGFTSGLARGLLLFCGAELLLALGLLVAAGLKTRVQSSMSKVQS